MGLCAESVGSQSTGEGREEGQAADQVKPTLPLDKSLNFVS